MRHLQYCHHARPYVSEVQMGCGMRRAMCISVPRVRTRGVRSAATPVKREDWLRIGSLREREKWDNFRVSAETWP